ncbi:small RNA degrading nuclease 5-like protein [Perkinsela sp. CCAP 1560/4]|nr:small RNA degrading nuclease 5-like protein [Perkinsela sp. CCAP 1560/4]|eukprot:KNH06382.1 small RNA degrading nuclease 5-like protein [Perkinsela sp. CCAP 1560/4]
MPYKNLSDTDCIARIYGKTTSPEVKLHLDENRAELPGMKDVCKLLLGMIGHGSIHGEWYTVSNAPLISSVHVIMLDKVTSEGESHPQGDIKTMFQNLNFDSVPLYIPADQECLPCNALLSGRTSANIHQNKQNRPAKKDDKIKKELSSSIRKGDATARFADSSFFEVLDAYIPGWRDEVHNFMLSRSELRTNSYCTNSKPGLDLAEEFESRCVCTESSATDIEFCTYLRPREKSKALGGLSVVAVDCEMCLTQAGKELARVSLVDAITNKTLFDSFVQPENEIIDYLTPFSGITEETLQDCDVTLRDVQRTLFERFLFEDTILIGHSLDNDLHALRIEHSRVIDTSILYKHPRGLPTRHSLRYLALRHLSRKIQSSSHDSVEDAIACADLFKLKLVHGKNFGDPKKGLTLLDDLIQRKIRCTVIDRASHVQSLFQQQPLLQGSTHLNVVLANTNEIVFKRTLTTVKAMAAGESTRDNAFPDCFFSFFSGVGTEAMMKYFRLLVDAKSTSSVVIVIANAHAGSKVKPDEPTSFLATFV